MDTVNVVGAAEMMYAHPKTVFKLIGDGVLPAARIGKSFVLLRSDVLRHIENEIIKQTSIRMGGLPEPRRQIRRSKF